VIGGDGAHEVIGEQQLAGELFWCRSAENQQINSAGAEVIEGVVVEQLVCQRRPGDSARMVRARSAPKACTE